jgi:hypothetical protein
MKEKEIHGDGWDIDPMLDPPASRHATESRAKYVKPKAFYPCTKCSKPKVGIVLDGSHLVWKPHDRTTMSGAKMQCAISGAPLCANPPAGLLIYPSCPHRPDFDRPSKRQEQE